MGTSKVSYKTMNPDDLEEAIKTATFRNVNQIYEGIKNSTCSQTRSRKALLLPLILTRMIEIARRADILDIRKKINNSKIGSAQKIFNLLNAKEEELKRKANRRLVERLDELSSSVFTSCAQECSDTDNE